MIKKLNYIATALTASVAFASGAVVYTEDFNATGTADRSFSDFGWTGVKQDGTSVTTSTSNPRLNTNNNFGGNADSYGTFVSATTSEQWFVSDFGGTTSQITEISFLHRDTNVATAHGYLFGLKIGGSWYLQDTYVAMNTTASAIKSTVNLSTDKFKVWADASTGDTDGWTTNPTLGSGVLLTETQAKTVTAFGIFTTADTTSDAYRFDQIKITTVPEPSYAALLGLGGLALVLRRRK